MRTVAIVLSLMVLPTGAAAHGSAATMQGFYSGLVHPLVEAEQALSLVALALLGAQLPKTAHQRSFVTLVGGLIAGLGIGLIAGGAEGSEGLRFIVLTVGVLAGGATAAALGSRFDALWVLGLPAGLGLGLLTAPEAGTALALAITIGGSLLGLGLVWVYASAVGAWAWHHASLKALPIAVRVVASWIAAICLLMLALAFAP
ncbi:MAG: HupE/UreJ family protein [Pseudomonadota bacterium]